MLLSILAFMSFMSRYFTSKHFTCLIKISKQQATNQINVCEIKRMKCDRHLFVLESLFLDFVYLGYK